MRALLVGDLHIENNKSSIANSSSFQEVFATFDLIREKANEFKPDFIIFFGDIFNSPESISSVVMTIVSEIFTNLSIDFTTLFISGNHDIIDDKISDIKVGNNYLKIQSNLLSPFSNYPNVVVFNTPKVIKIQPGVEVAFIPFSNNILQNLDDVNERFSVGSKRILMGHFNYLEYYHTVKESKDMSTNLPSKEELIEKYKYDLVLLGHQHDIYESIIDNKLVKYIGSCRNVDFRNSGEFKGLYLFDFDTLNMEYIDNPHTSIYKVFKSFGEVKEYALSNTPEKLAKTKILYIYNDKKDVIKLSKFKEYFKMLKFQKANITNNTDNLKGMSAEAIHEFEDLIKNNLMTREKLIEYSLQFKEPHNKDIVLKLFDYI